MSEPEPAKGDIMPPPDKSDDYGMAWRVNLAAVEGQGVPINGTLAQWIIEARWAHPFWHSYVLTLVHLRPIEGFEPAIIHVPNAQYEFTLFALQPDQDRAAMVREANAIRFRLEPCNFMAQFWEVNDEAAIQRIAETIDLVLAAKLNPDTDGRQCWIKLFGNAGIRPEWR